METLTFNIKSEQYEQLPTDQDIQAAENNDCGIYKLKGIYALKQTSILDRQMKQHGFVVSIVKRLQNSTQ